ncbi:MAG: hypothetical protein R2860_06585 [Desulfobacterales bacterium]
MGTSVVAFGAISNWLVDVLNILTGIWTKKREAPCFPCRPIAPSGKPGRGKGFKIGRWKSRVKGYGEVMGELPGRHPGR